MRFARTILGMTAAALIAACASTSTGTAQSSPAVTGGPTEAVAGGLLYVCNQDDASVAVIDLATLAVVRTVDLTALGFSRNAKPHHIVVEPDGSFWYVSLIGDGKVVKLDRNDRVIGSADFSTPGMLALHPTEPLLFVGRSMTAVNPPPSIGMIRRSTMEMIEEVNVLFPRPHAVAVRPSGDAVYTASLGVNQLAALNPQTENVQIANLEGPQHALMQFAIAPDGNTMVGSAELSHQLLVFDIGQPMQPKRTASITVGHQPFDPVYTPDGRWVYLGNKAMNTITVVDMQTREVAKVIEHDGIKQPHGAVATPDGAYVLVSNNNLKDPHVMHGPGSTGSGQAPEYGGPGTVVVIDTRTQNVVKVIDVGRNASGLGLALPLR
jgi:YVTN family beta-propeller protein